MKHRVLVVEDEKIIRMTLHRALVAQGHETDAVGTGEEALVRLAERRYDLVITDLALPGMDGLEVVAEAKGGDPDMAAMVLTGYSDTTAALEALRGGAEDYVAKPCDFDELLLRAARCLELNALRRRVRVYEAGSATVPPGRAGGD